MTLHKLLPAVLAGLALASLGMPAGAEPDESVMMPHPSAAMPQEQTSPAISEAGNGTRYVSGGVTEEEREGMRELAHGFPLRITSAERQGNLVPGVDVTITDSRGRQVMEVPDAGPVVYVMVPKGRYKVVVRNGDQTASRQISIAGATRQDVAFVW